MYATKMPTAQTLTVPITVLVRKDILEMETSVKVLCLRPSLAYVFEAFDRKTSAIDDRKTSANDSPL